MSGLQNFGQGLSSSLQTALSRYTGGAVNPGANPPSGFAGQSGSLLGDVIAQYTASQHPAIGRAMAAYKTMSGAIKATSGMDISSGASQAFNKSAGLLGNLVNGIFGSAGAAPAGASTEAEAAAASTAGGASSTAEGGASLAALL